MMDSGLIWSRCHVVEVGLVGCVEAVQAKGVGRGILVEIKAGVLSRNHEEVKTVLLRQEVTKGYAFVVCAENQIQPARGSMTFAQRNRELVVMVRHMAFCTQRIFPGGLL